MNILLSQLANPKGVGIVVLQNGKVLLGKRKDSGEWGLAGGGIDPGEEPLEAAIRELREEFGIVNNNLKYFGVAPSLINPFKGTDSKEGCSIDYYVEYELDQHIEINLQPEEMLEFKWVDLDKALDENLYSSSRASLELFLRV
jgi:8-oxo-dGTP pyrophosphatase MutT (NUDIX family)